MPYGALTERLRGALQKLINGFDSHTCLQILTICADGGMVYTRDLKSLGLTTLRVQVPLCAPIKNSLLVRLFLIGM